MTAVNYYFLGTQCTAKHFYHDNVVIVEELDVFII